MPLDSWKNYTRDLDTGRVSAEVLAELLRQAEMRQEAIFRAALGMDQRASILAGGFAAAAGAVAAAALTLGAAQSLYRPSLVAAVFLALAAGLCAFACRPQPFRFPGTPPNDWARDPAYMQDNTLQEIQMDHVARLQDWMHDNEARQRQNGRYLSLGLAFAVLGPITAAVVSIVLH